MTNKYQQFLEDYDRYFEDGITQKEFAKRLGLSAPALSKYLVQSGKREPIQPTVYRAGLVRDYITNNGGSIVNALIHLGFDNPYSLSFPIRKHFYKEGWEFRYYKFVGLELGTYRGGLMVEGAYDLPYNQRRIEVECLNCGHKHSIAISSFSCGNNHKCIHCPQQERIHRKHLLVETGEVGSLLGLWKSNLRESLPYPSLRYRINRDGYYKCDETGLTVVLLDTEEPRIKASLEKGKGERRMPLKQAVAS